MLRVGWIGDIFLLFSRLTIVLKTCPVSFFVSKPMNALENFTLERRFLKIHQLSLPFK